MKKSELRQMIKEELLKESAPIQDLEIKFLKSKEAIKFSKQLKNIASQAENTFETFSKMNKYGDMGDKDVYMTWNNVLQELIGLGE